MLLKRSISKRNLDPSNGTHSVNTQIYVKLPQVSSKSIDLHGPMEERRPIKRSVRNTSSRKEISFVRQPPNGSEYEMPRKPNLKTGSVPRRKNNNPTSQVIVNHLGLHSVCNVAVIATPMKVDEWLQIKNEKRPKVAKEMSVPQTVAEKLKIDHSDRSLICHRVKESESSEPRTLFEHDIELRKEPLNQLMLKKFSGITLLNVYRLGSLMDSELSN